MWISPYNFLAVELENQTQHTVGGWMLGAEVDSVVPDLPLGSTLILE